MTAPRWQAPKPPPGKDDGPEGRAGWIVDLWASGDEERARELAALPLKGGKKADGKPVPAESAYVGVDPKLAGGGSMNWAVAMASARYVALGDAAAKSWLLGYADPQWPLWRRETLSQTYCWVLHHAAAALRAARERKDRPLEDVLRDLLRRHLALVMSLRWRFSGARKLSGYDDPVLSVGERSPHGKLNGKRLTTFTLACLGELNAVRPAIETAISKLHSTGWPERSLAWSRPSELSAAPVDRAQAEQILRRDVTLATTLEVGRLPNGDGWTRLVESRHQSTAPTLATSVVGGKLHPGGVHEKGDREGLGRGYTRREGGRILMWATRADTGVTLRGEIPCPSAAGAEVWHLGPGGWGSGAAPAVVPKVDEEE